MLTVLGPMLENNLRKKRELVALDEGPNSP